MEAGDLHDPGRLYRDEHEDGESIAPQQALAEMRIAVERLRRQLHAGRSVDQVPESGDEAVDEEGAVADGGPAAA